MTVQKAHSQQGMRYRLYRQMEPSAREQSGLSPVNAFIVCLVLFSLITLALETEPTLTPGWQLAISVSNYAILAIFAIEYLIRIWIVGEDPRYRGIGGRLRYMCTPYALADLMAFLPEILWLILSQGEGEEMLMVLRILRLARLMKIARFVPAFDVLGAAMQRAGSQLLTTLALALALVYVSAVALYFIEGVGQNREDFASIPRAIWWAVATLTTVGYGDVYPITVLGRIAAAIIALAGIGVVALPAGVFASAFSDELRERGRAKRERDDSGARPAAARRDGEKPPE